MATDKKINPFMIVIGMLAAIFCSSSSLMFAIWLYEWLRDVNWSELVLMGYALGAMGVILLIVLIGRAHV